MANQQTNRINVTLTAAQITAVKNAITTIHTNLPFLLGITPEERMALPKINVQNKVFTEDALSVAQNNANILPAFINVANLANDYTLYNQLDELRVLINQLNEKIEDTQMLAGSEAYVSALTIFKLAKAGAEAGVPGMDTIAEQLGNRFSGQGGSGSTTPTTNPNTPS